MRIGIVPGLNFADGGIYQYSVTMLQALEQSRGAASADELVLFANDLQNVNLFGLSRQDWILKPLLPPTLKRQSINFVERVLGPRPRETALKLTKRWLVKRGGSTRDPDHIQFNQEMHQWFLSNRIDLMLYPTSTSLSFEAGIPYILTVHDLQHRLQPEFPEVSANGEWQSREYLFKNGIRHATMVLAESETGKEDILNFYGAYGISPDRIEVLPLLPSPMLETSVPEAAQRAIRSKYNLSERYLFYPAQFWPHKNHVRIIEALGLIKQNHGVKVPIVLCGSQSGELRQHTFDEVLRTAAKLQIEDQVYLPGYITDQEIAAFYKTARALVMPTFFGATNIPPLEAWAFGCPVLTSDIRGIREQAGSAALLVDPKSVAAIAQGIHRLWIDDELCHELIQRGFARIQEFTFNDYANRLSAVLEAAKASIHAGSAPALTAGSCGPHRV